MKDFLLARGFRSRGTVYTASSGGVVVRIRVALTPQKLGSQIAMAKLKQRFNGVFNTLIAPFLRVLFLVRLCGFDR